LAHLQDHQLFQLSLSKPQAADCHLTERQRQVVALIAAGCANEQVAASLGISPRTARAHCDVLRFKLSVARRRQIPVAYRALTGEDPLLAASVAPSA
jgi:DNA-binding CsgD family transcriptional regulator